jgi:glutamyl-tRNA synthetase
MQLVAGTGFEPALSELAAALSDGRNRLVPAAGLSAADCAVWGALSAQSAWEKLKTKAPFKDVATYFSAVTAAFPEGAQALDEYLPAAAKAAKAKVAAAAAARAEAAAAKAAAPPAAASAANSISKDSGGGSFEIGLVDAVEGAVVTRFPPEPSGFLHIGHAKAALLNEYFARQYKGRLILRFDDTNPAKEKDDFVQAILADVATLGIAPDVITYSSDHFDALLVKAGELLKEGKCYVDDTPVELMREQRMHGIPSPRRDASVEDNLARWGDMVAGNDAGRLCCVRFKIDMQHPNKALRDPVAWRCNVDVPHHRTGTRYKVYPTYDAACPFVDAAEGVTHALRTSEYKDREAQYYWIAGAMGLRKVHLWDYSRLNFEFTTLSKRKLGALVTAGAVSGWDDPRFPTVQGVARRGLQVPALREFILNQGASKNVNLQTWEKLWTFNKRVIDPVCPRHTCVEAHKVLVTLAPGAGVPEQPEVRLVAKHKKWAAAGEKPQWRAAQLWIDGADAGSMAEGEEVTLMDWGNCVMGQQTVDGSGRVVGIAAVLKLDGDVKATKLKLHWLAHCPGVAAAQPVPLVVKEYGTLLSKKKFEDEDDVASLFNKESETQRQVLGDVATAQLKKGDVLQLERKGYFICDVPAGVVDAETGLVASPAVLIGIPDGREKK